MKTELDILKLADMTYWYPILEKTGIRVPRTIMVDSKMTDDDLMGMVDGITADGWDQFVREIHDAGSKVGYPLFLRTAFGSGKHEWFYTCYVPNAASVASRIVRLIIWSSMAGMMGLPMRHWAVRQLLPTDSPFEAFEGLPITREVRVFINDGETICTHPYWPADAIRDPTSDNWREELEALNALDDTETASLHAAIDTVKGSFEGGWSLDFLWSNGEWYAIDMAPAVRSYHWPDCSENIWRPR